jgi:hypothetical protein
MRLTPEHGWIEMQHETSTKARVAGVVPASASMVPASLPGMLDEDEGTTGAAIPVWSDRQGDGWMHLRGFAVPAEPRPWNEPLSVDWARAVEAGIGGVRLA